MSNPENQDFWAIVEYAFPEFADDKLLDEARSRRIVKYNPDADEKEIQGERIIAASYDGRIADYFIFGIGSEELLIAQLQREYGLNEQEATEAIDRGISQLNDVTDYGYEA